MAINSIGTPIALQIRPLDLLRNEQIKGARMENEAFAQQRQRENALASFFQQSGGALQGGDQNALTQFYGIDPKGAAAFEGQQLGNEKARAEAQERQNKAARDGIAALLNAPEGANLDALYGSVRQHWTRMGMDDAPEKWDPVWARTMYDALSTEDERAKRLAADPAHAGRVREEQTRGELRAKQDFPEPQGDKPPVTRNVIMGNNEATQQWNPETRTWETIGSPGPRFNPNTGGSGGAPGGRTLTERMQNIVLNGDPSTPEYGAAYAYLAKPRVLFDPNTGESVQVAPDMSWARKPGSGAAPGAAAPMGAGGGEGRPEVTRAPGMSASPTQATFQANVQQAQEDVAKAEEMLFPGGTFDRNTALTGGINIPFAGAGLPFSKGREARQAVRRAVEIILRLRTGAAAPDQEVDNYLNLYAPSPADSESSARTKMDRLRQFFETEKAAAASKLPQAGASAPAPSSSGRVIDFNSLPD